VAVLQIYNIFLLDKFSKFSGVKSHSENGVAVFSLVWIRFHSRNFREKASNTFHVILQQKFLTVNGAH